MTTSQEQMPEGAQGRLGRPPGRGELFFYRVCRFVAVGLSRLLFPGRVLGAENLPPSGPYILAPVHRSYVDWLLVARLTRRRLRYIVKAEVWKSKAVGRLIEALGAFPVNRSGADREALERCQAVLAGGEPLVMFPEGTRRSGPEVEDLREGVAYLALRAGVPIVPVGIGGSEQAMPRGAKLPRPRRIDLVVGEAILPSGDRSSKRVSRRQMTELSEQVRQSIKAAFAQAGASLEETTMSGRPRS